MPWRGRQAVAPGWDDPSMGVGGEPGDTDDVLAVDEARPR